MNFIKIDNQIINLDQILKIEMGDNGIIFMLLNSDLSATCVFIEPSKYPTDVIWDRLCNLSVDLLAVEPPKKTHVKRDAMPPRGAGTIKIRLGYDGDEFEEVQATVIGDFAIHLDSDETEFVVTHVPTGIAFPVLFRYEEDAMEFIRRLPELELPPLGTPENPWVTYKMSHEVRRKSRGKIYKLAGDIHCKPIKPME